MIYDWVVNTMILLAVEIKLHSSNKYFVFVVDLNVATIKEIWCKFLKDGRKFCIIFNCFNLFFELV